MAWLLAIVLLSGLFRAVISFDREWVGYDEANYLMIGRNATAGLGYVQSPLSDYRPKFHVLSFMAPQAVAAVVGDELLASKLLFVLSGMLTVAFVAGLGANLFRPHEGLVAAGFTAVAPVMTTLAGPSISHSIFNPFFVAGLWAAWLAARRGSGLLAAASGLLIGLSWWARADGLLVAPCLALFLLAGGTLLAGPRRSIVNTVSFSASFGVAYWLYAWTVRFISGGASRSHGPLFDFLLYPPTCNPNRPLTSYSSMLELAMHEPNCVAQKIFENLDTVPAVLFTWTGLPLVLLPLLGAALAAEPRYTKKIGAAYLLLVASVLPLLGYLPFYFHETRYVGPYAAVTFIWCARGALGLGGRLRPRWGQLGFLLPSLATIGFLLLTTLAHVPRLRGISGPEYVEAGKWIEENSSPETTIWTTQAEVAFFAHRAWIYPPPITEAQEFRRNLDGELLVVADQRNFFSKEPTWRALESPEDLDWLEAVFRSSVDGPGLTVYRVIPDSSTHDEG